MKGYDMKIRTLILTISLMLGLATAPLKAQTFAHVTNNGILKASLFAGAATFAFLRLATALGFATAGDDTDDYSFDAHVKTAAISAIATAAICLFIKFIDKNN